MYTWRGDKNGAHGVDRRGRGKQRGTYNEEEEEEEWVERKKWGKEKEVGRVMRVYGTYVNESEEYICRSRGIESKGYTCQYE